MDRGQLDPVWDAGLGFGPVRSQRASLRLPWEHGVFSFVGGAQETAIPTVQEMLEPSAAQPKPVTSDQQQAVRLSRAATPPPLRVAHLVWHSEQAKQERQGALSRWSALLRLAPALFGQAAAQVLDADYRKEQVNLEVVFCKKSTNTVLTRAYSIKKFVLWCSYKFPLDPLSEPLLYLHLQELQEKQSSPSAADSLLGSLGFAWGTLGLSVNLSVLSPRVLGLAHLQLKQRRPPQPAPPLTVREARFLELLANKKPICYETLIAGCLCFSLYGRARNSDVYRAQDIQFDWAKDKDSSQGCVGFVECQVLNPKQAKASSKSNRLLPLVAPARGLLETPWAQAWQDARTALSLPCSGKLQDSALFPALAANGSLLPAALSSSEVGRWLRALLSQDPQVDQDRVLKLRSHSLKVTVLSWCAKAGIDQDSQTLLGYHSLGINKSSLVYSRDALSGPLRHLEKVLQDIRQGKFDPDDTRSGRWHTVEKPTGSQDNKARQVSQDADSDVSEASSSECVSSDSEDEQVTVQDATHMLSLVVESGKFSLFTHQQSCITHLSQQGSNRFCCGRSVFGRYKSGPSLSAHEGRLCHVCGQVAQGILDRSVA